MKNKSYTELIEMQANDPMAFQKELELFADGQPVNRHTFEDVAERLLDAAQNRVTFDDGTTAEIDPDGMIRGDMTELYAKVAMAFLITFVVAFVAGFYTSAALAADVIAGGGR